jgi:hypothetical protein
MIGRKPTYASNSSTVGGENSELYILYMGSLFNKSVQLLSAEHFNSPRTGGKK